ncbi:MAG: DivIVA domain-containing protein, partial [Longicatena caecimuris]|uniref:DivIVA domain-containing protein n=1 Tax=Longicatena caecimuris TaxID=1796635 RepID=UPI00399A9EE6
MEKRFKLSVEDVLNKQFNVDLKGYSSREVDEFLDLVIHDYQEYDHMIENLGNHLQEYERHISTLKAKIVELEGKQEVEAIKAELSGDNIDILK